MPGDNEAVRDGGVGLKATIATVQLRLDKVTRDLLQYDSRRSACSDAPIELDSAHCLQAIIEGMDNVKNRFWTTTWLRSRFWAGRNTAIAASNVEMAKRMRSGGTARRLFLLNQPIQLEVDDRARERLHALESGAHDALVQSRQEVEILKAHVSDQEDAGFEVKVVHDANAALRSLPGPMWQFTDRPGICIYDDWRVDVVEAGREGRIYSCKVFTGLSRDFNGVRDGATQDSEDLWKIATPMRDFLRDLDDRLASVEGRIRYVENWLAKYELDMPGDDESLQGDELSFFADVLKNRAPVRRWCDVGTCTGRLVQALSEFVDPEGVVVAVDNNHECVELANRKLARREGRRQIQVLLWDWLSDFDPDGVFDLVTCGSGTVSYWGKDRAAWLGVRKSAPEDSMQLGLQKCANQLSAGGVLLLATWSMRR